MYKFSAFVFIVSININVSSNDSEVFINRKLWNVGVYERCKVYDVKKQQKMFGNQFHMLLVLLKFVLSILA